MYIDKSSPIPAYFQLMNSLKQKISEGEFPVGGAIPSERELADTLNISRMTVRQALSQLVQEGVLKREKGRGTFVSAPKIEQDNIMSFSDAVRMRGITPITKLLHLSKDAASAQLCSLLDLKENEMVYHVKRLRIAGETPVGIEQNFIPEKFCPRLEQYDLTASLYNIFKTEYGFSIRHVDHVIEAGKPSKDERELLHVTPSASILKVNCLNFTDGNFKLFYEESIYRSDEYQYKLRVFVNSHI